MGDKERILLVDDHEMTLEMLKRSLESRGFEIIATAKSVESVIALLENGQTGITLAIIDNRMPKDGDGEKAAALIRKAVPGVKIISHAMWMQEWGDINLEKGATLKEIAEVIKSL
jgi:DNA-binding NarL/FixJ family response regulator